MKKKKIMAAMLAGILTMSSVAASSSGLLHCSGLTPDFICGHSVEEKELEKDILEDNEVKNEEIEENLDLELDNSEVITKEEVETVKKDKPAKLRTMRNAPEGEIDLSSAGNKSVIGSYDESSKVLTVKGDGELNRHKFHAFICQKTALYQLREEYKNGRFINWYIIPNNNNAREELKEYTIKIEGKVILPKDSSKLFYSFHTKFDISSELDVSNVEDASFMFSNNPELTLDTGKWNTSSMTTMRSMFQSCEKVNPDVSNWDTGNVTNMSEMFADTKQANPDTSKWNTQNVTNMQVMFKEAEMANPDVSNWDTGNVTNMSRMFANTKQANPNTSKWNTQNVTDMSEMFKEAEEANPNVSKWDLSNVDTIVGMFAYAPKANPDVSKWNTSNITQMSCVFECTEIAVPDVSNWDTSNVTNMGSMFNGAKKADPDVSKWDTSNVTDISYIFANTEKANPDVSKWNTSKMIYMNYAFGGAKKANPDVSNWDTSNVISMVGMFNGAKKADPDVSKWDVSNVVYVEGMFKEAMSAKPDLKNWDIGRIKSMPKMFESSNVEKIDFRGFNVESLVINPYAKDNYKYVGNNFGNKLKTIVAKGDFLEKFKDMTIEEDMCYAIYEIKDTESYDADSNTGKEKVGRYYGKSIDTSGIKKEGLYELVALNEISVNPLVVFVGDKVTPDMFKSKIQVSSQKNISNVEFDDESDAIKIENAENQEVKLKITVEGEHPKTVPAKINVVKPITAEKIVVFKGDTESLSDERYKKAAKDSIQEGADVIIIGKENVDTENVGDYKVKVRIEDKDGNKEEYIVPVIVKEPVKVKDGHKVTAIVGEKLLPSDDRIKEVLDNVPEGATIEFVDEGPDTTKPIESQKVKVKIKGQDGIEEEIDVPIAVKKPLKVKDDKKVTVYIGEDLAPSDDRIKDALDNVPENATFEFAEEKVDTSKPGEKVIEVIVTVDGGPIEKAKVPVKIVKRPYIPSTPTPDMDTELIAPIESEERHGASSENQETGKNGAAQIDQSKQTASARTGDATDIGIFLSISFICGSLVLALNRRKNRQ